MPKRQMTSYQIGATVTIRWIDAQTDGPQRRVPSRTEQTHRIPRGNTTCAQLAGPAGDSSDLQGLGHTDLPMSRCAAMRTAMSGMSGAISTADSTTLNLQG